MRIARYTTGDEPQYGVVGGTDGDEIIATVVGDPLYAGVELTGEQVSLPDVRLLAPVIPRSKVVCVGRNYVAHAQELDHDIPEQPQKATGEDRGEHDPRGTRHPRRGRGVACGFPVRRNPASGCVESHNLL